MGGGVRALTLPSPCGACGASQASVSQSGFTPLTGWDEEEPMAKGQMRSSKEAKKPKSDKPKSSMSEYKKSQLGTGQAMSPPGKKS
jgi:hypothetical protein